MHPESATHKSPANGVDENMGTAAEDAEGLKRSVELSLDDRARDRASGRGEHLDDDVPIGHAKCAASWASSGCSRCSHECG